MQVDVRRRKEADVFHVLISQNLKLSLTCEQIYIKECGRINKHLLYRIFVLLFVDEATFSNLG